ncbi:MAG TPA: hypothetical protein VFP65_15020, partial [Anaeromyxobacteraceae bacterium]|nr:hypothetical protein [Anaeromyxobacteraceae bacterium]
MTDTVKAAAQGAADAAGADGPAAAILGLVGRRAAHGKGAHARPGEAAFPDLLGQAIAARTGGAEQDAAAAEPGEGADAAASEPNGRPSLRPTSFWSSRA